MIGLFCKRALFKRLYSAEETYHFKEPITRSHKTYVAAYRWIYVYVYTRIFGCVRVSFSLDTFMKKHMLIICIYMPRYAYRHIYVVIPHKCTYANMYCLCGCVQRVCTQRSTHMCIYVHVHIHIHIEVHHHILLYVFTYGIRIVCVGVYREAHPPTPSIYIIYM